MSAVRACVGQERMGVGGVVGGGVGIELQMSV